MLDMNYLRSLRLAWIIALAMGIGVANIAEAGRRDPHEHEVQYSSDEFKKLTTFEATVLGDADSKFAKYHYKAAATGYNAFVVTYPTSAAVPYALLRKARCLHLGLKRYEAIREYQEVIDFFPNRVQYAAPALYHIGEAQWQNGDEAKAVQTWVKMAEDKDYAKHTLAAYALNRLGEYLMKHKKPLDAVRYYKQVAIDFRHRNRDASNHAIDKLIHYYVRVAPNEKELRDLYTAVKTFHDRARRIPEDVSKDSDYWNSLRHHINRNAPYFRDPSDAQKQERERYYKYWAEQLDGRFLEDDDYQLDLARWKHTYEKDIKKYYERFDAQFKRKYKDGNWGRIIDWIGLYRGHKEKQMEYYRMLAFDKMKNNQILDLARTLYEDVGDQGMGGNAIDKVKWAEESDDSKASWAQYLWKRDEPKVKYVLSFMNDKTRGKYELLRFHFFAKNTKEGIPLAKDLSDEPDYAKSALNMWAEMLESEKKWREAITVWRQVDEPPDTSFKIAECWEKSGSTSQAVAQLKEIEGFFRDHRDTAPRAALAVAHVYKRANNKANYKASLWQVLNKYPDSNQSSQAHRELEALGERIGGAVTEKNKK